jgi:hypothetical protein
MSFQKHIKNFSSFLGLKQDISTTNITSEYALIAQNCRFRQAGAVRHKEGYGFFNSSQPVSTPIVSSKVLGLYQFKYRGTDKLLAAIGQYIYIDDGSTIPASGSAIKSGQSTTDYYSFCSLNDACYIVNNVDDNLKYDGADVSAMCIAAPVSSGITISKASGSSGLSAGDYGYLVTYVNKNASPDDYYITSGQESNPDDLLNYKEITVAPGDDVTLGSVPYSPDPQVSHVNVYRPTVNGSIYDAQFCCSVANIDAGGGLLADITATDGTSKADTDLENIIQLFHSVAPKMKKIVTHQNKVFGFEKNSTYLNVSYDYNGWYFPKGEFGSIDFRVEVSRDDGDYIQNIVSFIGGLIVFKSNSIWILEGYDQYSFRIRKINYDESIGCVGHRGAVVKNNIVYFVDNKGVFATNGNEINKVSGGVQGFFNNENLILGLPIDKPLMANVCVGVDTYNSNKVIKFSFTPLGGSVNSLHLVYDYELNIWSNDTGYNAQSYCIYEDENIEYLLRGDDLGYIFKESINTYGGAYDIGTSSASGMNTVVDISKSWTTNEFRGCYVLITSGSYLGVRKRITANDSVSLTVESNWGPTLPLYSGSNYIIGGSEAFYVCGWGDYGAPGLSKRLKFVRPRLDCSKTYNIDIFNWYDFNANISIYRSVQVTPSLIYDGGEIWNKFYWGIKPIETLTKATLPSSLHVYHAYGFRCYDSTAGVVLNNYDKCFQIKGISGT